MIAAFARKSGNATSEIVNAWIKCSEKMPQLKLVHKNTLEEMRESAYVLVFVPGRSYPRIAIGQLFDVLDNTGIHWGVQGVDEGAVPCPDPEFHEVTHWMPLPSLPEKSSLPTAP
jgi:Protein of unknown function (DUF551)